MFNPARDGSSRFLASISRIAIALIRERDWRMMNAVDP